MRTLKYGLFAAILSAPLWGATPAHPGMLNYVEGQASIDGQPVTAKSVGSADVEQGQILETHQGKAEILLTPGVFLRLGDNSALRMDIAGLTHTSAELLRGEALVEATDLHQANNIQIVEHGAITTLDKNGLYRFDVDHPEVAVYDGKATVQEGDRHTDLKKGHEVAVDTLKTEKFDTKAGDDLYQWSNLRSRYLSDASMASARTFVVNTGGWYGGGWYWNPWYGFYSYLPGDGFLYSPFGWGFYSPRGIYYGGGYRYGYRGPVTNRGFVGGGPHSTSQSFAHPSAGFSGGHAFSGGGSHGGPRR